MLTSFSNCLIFIVLSSLLVSAQLTAPTRNYNVTSPVPNGPYVIDQILPCTYHLFSDVDTSSLKLSIQLKAISLDSPSLAVVSSAGNAKTEPSAVAPPAAVAAATAGSSISSPSSSNSSSITTKQEDIVIAENADVSKTGEKHAGNVTYYEHSVNYKIPQTIRPGKYNVVFYDKSTDTQLEVPIEIRSAAIPKTPRSGAGSSSGESTKGDTRNIYAASGIKTTAPLSSSSFSISLFCVFIAAITAVSAII